MRDKLEKNREECKDEAIDMLKEYLQDKKDGMKRIIRTGSLSIRPTRILRRKSRNLT